MIPRVLDGSHNVLVMGATGGGDSGKTTLFGIFERDGQVYTEIVPNSSKLTLQAIIRGKVDVFRRLSILTAGTKPNIKLT